MGPLVVTFGGSAAARRSGRRLRSALKNLGRSLHQPLSSELYDHGLLRRVSRRMGCCSVAVYDFEPSQSLRVLGHTDRPAMCDGAGDIQHTFSLCSVVT